MASASETLVEGLLTALVVRDSPTARDRNKRLLAQTPKAPIEKATSVPRLGPLVGKALASAYSSLLMQWLRLYRVERKKK